MKSQATKFKVRKWNYSVSRQAFTKPIVNVAAQIPIIIILFYNILFVKD